MTSSNLKGIIASGALVLAGILSLDPGLTVRAQSGGAEFEDGLQGTWRVQLTVRDCQTGQALRTFPALFAFAKGGTLTFTTAGQFQALATPGVGIWRHTEGHTYSAVSEVFIFSPAGAWMQIHRLTRTIELGDGGDEFTDTVKLEIFGTTGNLIATGCGTSVASRFE